MITAIQFSGIEFDGCFATPGFYVGRSIIDFGFTDKNKPRNGIYERNVDDWGDEYKESAIVRDGWIAVDLDSFDAYDDDLGLKPGLDYYVPLSCGAFGSTEAEAIFNLKKQLECYQTDIHFVHFMIENDSKSETLRFPIKHITDKALLVEFSEAGCAWISKHCFRQEGKDYFITTSPSTYLTLLVRLKDKLHDEYILVKSAGKGSSDKSCKVNFTALRKICQEYRHSEAREYETVLKSIVLGNFALRKFGDEIYAIRHIIEGRLSKHHELPRGDIAFNALEEQLKTVTGRLN